MNKTKFTPGPWILHPREGDDTSDIVSSCETGWEIATVIGGINDSFTEKGSAESIANAKLIATAPDMITELQTTHGFLLQLHSALNNRNGLDFAAIQQDLRDRMAKQLEIIAKATT